MRAVVTVLFTIALCAAQAPKDNPEHLFNEALAAQQRGDLETAVADYEQVLRIMPGLIAARANLAAAQLQMGHVDDAIQSYRTALHQDSKNIQLAVLLGDVYVGQHRYGEAVSLLAPIEKAHPENLNVAFLMGEALIDQNQLADGLKRVERVAAARKDGNAWTLAALTELRLGQYTKAAASAEEALRLDPGAPGIYTISGMAKAANGDTAGAKAAYRKALEINPDDFDANLRLGTLLLRDGEDLAGARPYLERAFRLNPESLSAIFEMGQLAVAEKQDAEAIRDFEQVAQRAPNLLEPHVRLAVLYARAHRASDAAREKETVDHLMAQQQQQDPNALPDDLLRQQINGPPPSH